MSAVPLEAEQALLGSWMADPESWDLSSDLYVPGMFGGPWHNLIAENIARLLQGGKAADPVLVAAGIPEPSEEDAEAERPLPYIYRLCGAVGSAYQVRSYAEVVREAWAVRETRAALTEALETETASAASLIESTQKRLSQIEVGDVGEIRTMEQDSMEFMEALEAERDRRPGTEIRTTGFSAVDAITGGLETALPHVMAARPGGGKSAYATALARYSAGVLTEPTALIWLEDTRRKAMLRIAAAEAGIPAVLLRHGTTVPREAWDRLMEVLATRVSKWPLYIEEGSGLTPRQIAAKMRRLRREKGVRRFLCDHLAEMNLGEEGDKKTSAALGDALRIFRDALKACDAGGVMFHQLGREAEKGGPATISWLFNSDVVGQVARVIGFLKPEGKTMEITWAKCTYGPPGERVQLGWEPVTMNVFEPVSPQERML